VIPAIGVLPWLPLFPEMFSVQSLVRPPLSRRRLPRHRWADATLAGPVFPLPSPANPPQQPCPLMILAPRLPQARPSSLAHTTCPSCPQTLSGLYQESGLAPTDVPNLTVLNYRPFQDGLFLVRTTSYFFFYTPRVLHRPAIRASFAPFASSHSRVYTGCPPLHWKSLLFPSLPALIPFFHHMISVSGL